MCIGGDYGVVAGRGSLSMVAGDVLSVLSILIVARERVLTQRSVGLARCEVGTIRMLS